MQVNQVTPFGVRNHQTVAQALDILGRPMSPDIDADSNIFAVATIVRDAGWLARWQKVNIPATAGLYIIVNRDQIHTSLSGSWPENTEITGLVRSGDVLFQTSEIMVSSKTGGDFGSQPCKIKLAGKVKVRNNKRSLCRALDEEKLEAALKVDTLAYAEVFAAWFESHTVEEILLATDNGQTPDQSGLEVPSEHTDWTFDFNQLHVHSITHSKVVRDGMAETKRKQQARSAAIDGLQAGIKKIQPGRPNALKAMLDAITVELNGGNITAEEADSFGEAAHLAEEKRLQAEDEDKRFKVEAGIIASIAEATQPEHFADIHTVIGEWLDIIGDERARELRAQSQAVFASWFKAKLKAAEVPSDFTALQSLAEQYKMFLAEADAQALPSAISAELTKREAAVKREQASRVAAKTSTKVEEFRSEAQAVLAVTDPASEDFQLMQDLAERREKFPAIFDTAMALRRASRQTEQPQQLNPKAGVAHQNGTHDPEHVSPGKVEELTNRVAAATSQS